MKRTFRILEIKYTSGNIFYIVQQKWLGMWWKPSSKYRSLLYSDYGSDGWEYAKFADMEQVKAALELVREVMRNYRDSYKKVVDVIHIEV